MFKSLSALCIACTLILAPVTITGCAENPTTGKAEVVAPKSATQTVFVLEVSLTTATNALADLNAAGIVVGANYATAYDIQKRAHDGWPA